MTQQIWNYSELNENENRNCNLWDVTEAILENYMNIKNASIWKKSSKKL